VDCLEATTSEMKDSAELIEEELATAVISWWMSLTFRVAGSMSISFTKLRHIPPVAGDIRSVIVLKEELTHDAPTDSRRLGHGRVLVEVGSSA